MLLTLPLRLNSFEAFNFNCNSSACCVFLKLASRCKGSLISILLYQIYLKVSWYEEYMPRTMAFLDHLSASPACNTSFHNPIMIFCKLRCGTQTLFRCCTTARCPSSKRYLLHASPKLVTLNGLISYLDANIGHIPESPMSMLPRKKQLNCHGRDNEKKGSRDRVSSQNCHKYFSNNIIVSKIWLSNFR